MHLHNPQKQIIQNYYIIAIVGKTTPITKKSVIHDDKIWQEKKLLKQDFTDYI